MIEQDLTLYMATVSEKSAFAVAGVDGLGYAFSGGNVTRAQAIWTKSVHGTYILRPAHLRGEEPIHLLGNVNDDQSEASKHAEVTLDRAT